jgi:Zn-finger nucleic acid-binding protein
MYCPTCDHALRPGDREGVEIDFCPRCRGAWLGPGEWDRLMERRPDHGGQAAPAAPAVGEPADWRRVIQFYDFG